MDVILGVDLGEKNIGIAKSDELGITASPLTVIHHVNREADADEIVRLAHTAGAKRILVGLPLDTDGSEGPAARHAQKMAEAIHSVFDGEVFLWDETGSTNSVKTDFIEMGVSKKNRRGHLDQFAAAWILRDYLESQRTSGGEI